ncbi:MAG: hypothetical protein P1V35_09285 [Planctomycetota bacterium]|nr:hypothetical protein [Planctomycetota bacterium]
MKSRFTILCVLVLFACQSTPSIPAADAYYPLEFRGEVNAGEPGAQEFEHEGKTVFLSAAKHFDMKLFESTDQLGNPALGFTPIPGQRDEFGDYTEALLNMRLAILSAGKVLTLPNVNGRLGNGGILEGGRGGFTSEDVQALIASIQAGK